MSKTVKIILISVVAIVALIACCIGTSLVSTYNTLVTKSNDVDAAWKQVEVQYQRRFDLIPNLVETTKGLANQEKEVFDNIAKARANYTGAKTAEEKVNAANQVESSLSRLLVIVENYPNIKSDQAFIRLQDELAGTENRIAVERRRFNEKVQDYNTYVQVFPTNLVASTFGYTQKDYFNATPGSENVPNVDFDN